MRTFGSVHFDQLKNTWHIKAEPQVMLKLKALLCRVNKWQFNEVTLRHSPEVCRDLEWFMLRYPLAMDADTQAFMSSQSRTHQQTLESLEALNLDTYKPSVTGLTLPLCDYQSRAVEIGWARKSILNADQVGLGKSIMAIGSLVKPGTLPAVVVCETHLQRQWKGYLQQFLPSARTHIIQKSKVYDLPPSDVLIITYHKLHGWAEVLGRFLKTLIFDEVQQLRHPESGKYSAAKALRDRAEYVQGLSATPIYNYGGEIFNIIEIISPGHLGTEDEFHREWCSSQGGHKLLDHPEAFGNYLREQFLMIRRTRKEVGRELPPLETIVEPVEYNEKCIDDIDTVATELAHRILKGTFHEQGEAAREFDMKLRQATGIAKATHVAAFVRMLLEDRPKVLLSGWHRAVYDLWREHFTQAGIKFVLYTGSETEKQKDDSVKAFMQDAQVMIISHDSGAGVDGLQKVCDTVVHGELPFTPGKCVQLSGRLARDGQTNPVQEFYLVADGGSDPVIADILGLKTSQIRGLLEPKTVGLEKLQGDGGARVKRMAEAYLNKKTKST